MFINTIYVQLGAHCECWFINTLNEKSMEHLWDIWENCLDSPHEYLSIYHTPSYDNYGL